MEEQINEHKSELWNLTVKDLFFKYVRFLPLFLLSLSFALLVAWVYLRYSTRIYRSSGTMLIISESKTANRNDKVEDILAGSNRTQNILNEMEVLRSRPLMERVVNRLQLQFSYIAVGKIKEMNAYKQSPFKIEALELNDSSASFTTKIKFINNRQFRINNQPENFEFGQVLRNPYGVFRLIKKAEVSAGNEFNVTWQPTENVAGGLAAAIGVQPKSPGTGLLNVSIETTNPELSADVINDLMVQYDSATVEQNNFSTDRMIDFIDGRLHILDHELDSIQRILLEYQQRNNLLDIEAQSSNYFDKITEADRAINEQELRLNVVEMIDDYLRDKKNLYSKIVVPSSLGLEDITLNDLVNTYNRVQLERQGYIDGNTPKDNPYVVQAEGQIEKIRESLLENLRNIKASYSSAIVTMRRRSILEQSELQRLPYKIKEYVEIQRQVNTKLALYNLIEGKREEAAISRASTISNSKVINKATPSPVPAKPNKKLIQIVAILIGLGVPAILIFISEVVNDKVSTRYDIERLTKAPILGEVGHSYSDKPLIVNRTSRGMVAEQFRIIRSNLQYILPKIEKPVILVTSSVSGEGKSFVSINIGAVMALAHKKTVILEFDIRKPKVLQGLDMKKNSGITNYLLGKAQLEDLITPVPDHPDLFVLACGPIPPNPSELLLDIKVTEMFNWLRDKFDTIIVDTAPVGMVSDAMTLGKFADCTLYLVRQGHTFKKQITLIDEFYQEKKLPRVSIVINDVKLKPGYGYYGYGRYGYGYGYSQKSSYYEEETPPENFLERILRKLDIRKWFRKRK